MPNMPGSMIELAPVRSPPRIELAPPGALAVGSFAGRPNAQPASGATVTEHFRRRREWDAKVQRGECYCAAPVCHNPGGRWIAPGTPWDLDHTADRTGYRGPSHARCNRSTTGRQPEPVTRHSRVW